MSLSEVNHPITLSVEPPLEAAAKSLIRDAVRHEISVRHIECLRWFCSHPMTSEDLLLEIYESGLCRDDLGHRQGPRALLEKLANEARYPEAIITLAIQLYTWDDESPHDFGQFLARHADHLWMLESLARRTASTPEKEDLLCAVAASHPEAERLKRQLRLHRLKRRAAACSDPKEIDELYATGEPAVWLMLAGNRAVRRYLLEKLADVKDVPSARQIRNAAREQLAHLEH